MLVFFSVIGAIALLTSIMALYGGFQKAEKGARGGGWFESVDKVDAKKAAHHRSITIAYRFGFVCLCAAAPSGLLAYLIAS